MNRTRIFVLATIAALAAPAGLAASIQLPPEVRLLPENAVECGLPSRDISGYDLVGVHETGARPPDAPADLNILTFTIDEWRCVFPQEQVGPDSSLFPFRPAFDPDGSHPVPDHSHHGGLAAHDVGHTKPTTFYNNGYMRVYILLPNLGDSNYPSDQCNWDNVGAAMNRMLVEVGAPSSYERWCYYLPNWNTGGTTDVGTLLNQLHEAVSPTYQWMLTSRNSIMHGWVERADHNGAAWQYDRFSFTANHRVGWPDTWEDTVTMHEIGHTMNADHYPTHDQRNNCFFAQSVMNYCGMAAGVIVFDSGNRGRASTAWRAP